MTKEEILFPLHQHPILDGSELEMWFSYEDALKAMESYSSSLLKENEELKEKLKKLQSTCLAAAEEIQSKWDAHCDAEGYGPANLMRRLENGVGDYYSGYNAGQFTKLQSSNEAKDREIAELKEEYDKYIEEIEKENRVLHEQVDTFNKQKY